MWSSSSSIDLSQLFEVDCYCTTVYFQHTFNVLLLLLLTFESCGESSHHNDDDDFV